MFILLFEISDKVVQVETMYWYALLLGGIGFLLGVWHWKLSVLWLLFPNLLLTILFLFLQISEINALYDNIIRELGKIYIWQTYISASLSILLNITGIIIGIFKKKNLKLK
jgi:hypothetical protein